MAFHVEIRQGMNHARSFNVSPEDLQRDILEPWVEERPIELGEHDWDPRIATLTVIEGPELSPPELSFGQGWSNAERKATDVTDRLLGGATEERESRPAPTAIVVEVDSLGAAMAALGEMTEGREARQVEWSAARGRLDGRDPDVAAVVLITQRQARSEPPQS